MKNNLRNVIFSAAAALLIAIPWYTLNGQPLDRLQSGIGGPARLRLEGRRNPRLQGLTSEGPVEGSMLVRGITMRFRPSAQQSAELDQLLRDQQDASSPRYHQWLTPQEYGERFGLSANDFATVRAWVESQGFQIDDTAKSRTWMRFSGTAAQVRQAFNTDLHRYSVDGQMHYGNVSDVTLPANLREMVYTVRGLDDFGSIEQSHFNLSDGSHAIVPGDLAVIYNLAPLFDAGITGAGQKIVVTGGANVSLADVQNFRARFRLPKNDPQIMLVPGSRDPGFGEFATEALLNLDYAGASAPDATIYFVYAAYVLDAVEYAVDRNLAPVISYSFGVCELEVSQAPGVADHFRNVAKQANAQGITWVASSGDAGPAACDRQQIDKAGVGGLSVNVPASLPEVTAVGGTAFAEDTGSYWNSRPDATLGSARSYIPETSWNDTALDQTLGTSGGGLSILYPRPEWQTGLGVPNDNVRHVPDIAFAASWDHDPYVVVVNGDLRAGGGTSIAAPFFSGVLALLNQFLTNVGAQSNPGLGNVNPTLYHLSRTAPGVFHDVVTGDNIIPCRPGSLDCKAGSYGYKAEPGYDHVTGLGSIDVKALFDNWIKSTTKQISTTLSLAITPTSVKSGGVIAATATVKAAGGTKAPIGSVAFSMGENILATANLSGSADTATAVVTINVTGFQPGDNTIVATYSGADGFAPSTASEVVTVEATASAVELSVDPSPVYRQPPDQDGYSWHFTIRLSERAGIATTITAGSIDGSDVTSLITDWFGSVNLPANGSVSAALKAKNQQVPSDHIFAFAGMDQSGKRWNQQVTVSFRGDPEAGAMSLTSTPSAVTRPGSNPNCSADFPYSHQLNLKGLNGSEVKLTRFLAAGNDFTARIKEFFGATTLPAFGTMQASLCWRIDSVPATYDFEVDGADTSGRPVQAIVKVQFSNSGDSTAAAEAPIH